MPVPGPITSAASAGCHAPIRAQRAACVTSAAGIIAHVPLRADTNRSWSPTAAERALASRGSPKRSRLYERGCQTRAAGQGLPHMPKVVRYTSTSLCADQHDLSWQVIMLDTPDQTA